MMKTRQVSRIVIKFGFCFPLLCLAAGLARADKIPVAGSHLPQFQLEAPTDREERVYLGVGKAEKLTLRQIPAQLLIVEIIGVYCPLCHTQAPLFNRFFHRMQKDPSLNKQVKMMAIAAGANPTEIGYVKKDLQIPFPVLPDQNFKIHKLLGEPRTPLTLIITKDGKVLFSHVGVIKDMDDFYSKIKSLTP